MRKYHFGDLNSSGGATGNQIRAIFIGTAQLAILRSQMEPMVLASADGEQHHRWVYERRP